MPACSVPQDIADGIQALLAQYLYEAGDTRLLHIF